MNIGKKGCLLFLAAAMSMGHAVVATAGTGESSGINLDGAVFDEAQRAVPVVIYVYVEDDTENPYNDPDRDVTVEFGGTGDYLITGEAYHMLDEKLYKDYGIMRLITSLPSVGDDYYPSLTADDIPATGMMSYLVALNSKTPVDVGMGKSIPASSLQTGLNEFYFVGSSNYTWVKDQGLSKLEEMYRLLHSENGSINDNQLGNAVADKEVFSYWQQEMINDPTISGWEDEDGTVYTREDMERLGYPVGNDGQADGQETDAAGSDHAADADSPQPDSNTGDTTALPSIPQEADTNQSRSGIPPLAIVLVAVACATGAAVIAYIRRERNESDLYID